MRRAKTIKNFIGALEIVYSLFLAAGLSNLLFRFEFTATYFSLLSISVLVITRFFFAPSKNIEDLLNRINEKGRGYRLRELQFNLVVFCDVPILFIHAILFSIMCSFAARGNYFVYFQYFFWLLIVNSFWLFFIRYRANHVSKKGGHCRSKVFWAYNNLLSAGVMLLLLTKISFLSYYLFNINIIYYLLFIIGFLNCLADLTTQYRTYLFHDKGEKSFYV